MGKFELEIKLSAKKELEFHFRSGDKSTIRRIEQILQELATTPYEGIGNPEPLKYQLNGYWSRRLNKKDRIIYSVDENTVTVVIVSALGHY